MPWLPSCGGGLTALLPVPDLPLLETSLRIGLPSIDREHHALLSHLNRLLENPQQPASERFIDVLTRLGGEIDAHFRNEETVLGACGMPQPEVELHFQAHTEILEQYADLNYGLMNGEHFSRPDVLMMIQHWIIGHLMQHDLRIRDFLPAPQA
jgi:hemerythrin-like metal-binding protein